MVKLGYVRVSTDKQDPASQRALMKAQGILEEDIFEDYGVSGFIEASARPVYKKMLNRIADKTKEPVTEIVMSEFSRLGRNIKDSVYELLRLEHQGIIIQSLSKHETFLNECKDAGMQMVMLSAIGYGADIERKHHQERTQNALDNIKASGRKLGRPVVKINWEELEKTKEKYNVSENVARKILGYTQSTFYAAKKLKKEEEKQ